jgi:hypothetical protein
LQRKPKTASVGVRGKRWQHNGSKIAQSGRSLLNFRRYGGDTLL